MWCLKMNLKFRLLKTTVKIWTVRRTVYDVHCMSYSVYIMHFDNRFKNVINEYIVVIKYLKKNNINDIIQ